MREGREGQGRGEKVVLLSLLWLPYQRRVDSDS